MVGEENRRVGAVVQLLRAGNGEPTAEGVERAPKAFGLGFLSAKPRAAGGEKDEVIGKGQPRASARAFPHGAAQTAIVGAVALVFAKPQFRRYGSDISEHSAAPFKRIYFLTLYDTALF